MTRSVLCEWNPFRTYSTTLKVLEWNVVHRDMISMKASVVCTWKCSICMSISGCNCSVQINWKMAATDHPGAFEYFPMRFFFPLFSSQEENLTTPFEWSEDDGSNVVNFVIHFFFFFWVFVFRQRRNNSRRTWRWGGRCHLRVPWFSDKKEKKMFVNHWKPQSFRDVSGTFPSTDGVGDASVARQIFSKKLEWRNWLEVKF